MKSSVTVNTVDQNSSKSTNKGEWKAACKALATSFAIMAFAFMAPTFMCSGAIGNDKSDLGISSGSGGGVLFVIGVVFLGLAVLNSSILLGNYIFNKVGSTRRYDVLDSTQSNGFPSSSLLNINTVDQDHLKQHVTVRS